MTVIAEHRSHSPGPARDPGTDRGRVVLFSGGLVAWIALLAFGALALMAVLPMILPGYMSASITSGSMMPTLHVGDVVIAADYDGNEAPSGTVVVYEEPRKHDLVTHRVVSIDQSGSYITKGDGAGINDPTPIPAANIRGEARWIVPFVGLPRAWAAQQQWIQLILTGVVVVMALWLARFAFDPRYDPWPEEPRSDVDVST